LILTECPFTGEKVVLLLAIQPDVTIIHAQVVNAQGTVRIYGQSFADEQQAKAAKEAYRHLRGGCSAKKAARIPEHNIIPFFRVNAIVIVSYGAHPYACYRYYDYDPEFLRMYHERAKNDSSFKEFLDEYVYGVNDWEEYLKKIGGYQKLKRLKADKELRYAPKIKLGRK
jgi:glutaconate CoA-transferase subunit A